MKKNNKRIQFSILTIVTIPLLFNFINYAKYPSDILSYYDEWKITLGNGREVRDLIDYSNSDYFYIENDDWVVYKSPNRGGTTTNSSNTRSELRQFDEWTPETGGKMTGVLKVKNVSTTGDARVPASFSVVIGQIHSSEGHKNEPIKIFYKKFPGHTKGSVFWNYEINTEGSNNERWDYSTAVWGHDWSVVGSNPNDYPLEPAEGIEINEEFSYEINVYDGIMYLKFTSEGHETKTFTKSLISSNYTDSSSIPQQVLTIFSSTGQDGTEKEDAYKGEKQYFKQGTYNQANSKDPEENLVWHTGSDDYDGDIEDQYDNGSYAEVWFKEATVGPGVPNTLGIETSNRLKFNIFPNPARSEILIKSRSSIASLELVTISGEIIIKKSNVIGVFNKLNIESIQSGTYFLIIQDELNNRKVHKVIKQ